MQKISGARRAWSICVGILLAILGVGLMGFGIWHLLSTFLLFLGILLFLRKGQQPTSNLQERPAVERQGIYLGRFDLNGRSLEAYECTSDKNSTQLRLTSIPTLTHEQEAAFIRYIVNEGLAETIWPGMGKKIATEASWAFFKEKPALQREGIYLGSFDLNGYSFEAYECASNKNGTQLRLTSIAALTHEQEAAFIRYIVNEGLAETIWPGMGKKIAAEANWAFLE